MLVLLGVVGGCIGQIPAGEEGAPEPPQAVGPARPADLPAGEPPAGVPAGPAPPGPAFTCTSPAARASQPWRRLSGTAYRNTLRDLLAFGLKDANAAGTVVGALPLGDLPDDTGRLRGEFSRARQDVSQEHVQAWYRIAVATGRSVATRERVGALLGACATDAAADNDAACLTDFVRRFGERAFRRPLADDEVTFYRGFYGATPGVDPAGVGDVVGGLLMAPPFLFLTEHGTGAVPGANNVFTLSAYELAARLSYQFWETMPDQQLWDAARTGALDTADGYARELERVIADPRARRTLRGFFAEWLRVDDLPQVTTFNDDPVFKTFAGADLPKSALRDAMMQEVLDMVDNQVWDRGGALADLLSSDLVYPRSPELARIYGVAPWQPGSEPPRVPGDARPGLLTRAAFLVSGTANTRPIARGVFVRTGVLCDDIPPPPNGNAPPLPALSDKLTTRQTVEALTEGDGTACAGCHKSLINPIGFALETFDGLGRTRAEQRLFSRDGKEIGRAPVDTSSVPQVVLGDARPSRGVADLTRQIVDSGKVPACVARNYHRFTYARREDLTADGCALEQSRRAFARAGSGSLRSALRDVAVAPEFKQRGFAP